MTPNRHYRRQATAIALKEAEKKVKEAAAKLPKKDWVVTLDPSKTFSRRAQKLRAAVA